MAKKPNILIMWGDDIGQSNLSIFTKGMMGYRTPNIDRIAEEGMLFTDYYAEQSCTAGRASFITGQCGLRTGLTKVGLPGAALGMRAEDPTIAEVLKPLGYATGQFGKNHLGDRDEHLPTMHGFDEFFGNLYHLNAEEEPEHADYPTDKDFPNFKKKFGPRGVLHCWADGKGGQKIENTGPLTKKRMETADDEFLAAAKEFIKKAHASDTPFFVWFNTTHMHFRTYAKPESKGQSGRWQSEYHDVMIDHDKHIGELLALLDELGIADNTFVMYSTDNGPHCNSWPDAGTTPFRNEKNSNWEGAYRVPAMVRWPGKIKAGSVSNEIVSHLDWLPTFAAIAGEADIKEKLKKGHKAGSKTFKVHLDGHNLLPYLTGKEEKSPRKGFLYFTDDGDLACLRADNWKVVFMEQRVHGTLRIWAEPLVTLRVPKIFNLRTDPYEHADITSNTYYDWLLDRAFMLVPAQALVMEFLETLKEFPPRQKAASFNLDQAIATLESGTTGGH
jgi:arylsulfatase